MDWLPLLCSKINFDKYDIKKNLSFTTQSKVLYNVAVHEIKGTFIHFNRHFSVVIRNFAFTENRLSVDNSTLDIQ